MNQLREARELGEIRLLAEILSGDASAADGHWRAAVATLRGRFTEMRYCLES